MANQQLPPWLLMQGKQQQQPLNMSGPLNISLTNPNPGMSLDEANRIVEQQKQAASLGLVPQDTKPSYQYASSRTPEEDALIKQVSESYGQQRQLQQDAIKQAEEQLAAARAKPQQMDLSPLIALAEGWSQQPIGLLRAYQAPTDKAKTVQALQEAVLKARGGAAEMERMRAKDIQQLSQQERQLRTNEELKRLTIESMKKDKEGKVDTKSLDREIGLIDKISKSKEAEVIRGSVEMNRAIDNYVNTIKKHQSDLTSAEARADIGQAYNSTLMAFKNANVLGALTGPDLGLAQQKLPDLSTYASAAKRFSGISPDVNTTVKIIGDIKKEYGGKGKEALKTLESGYGKFGGKEILNQYKSDLESSGMDDRQQKIEEIKRRRSQGVSQ